MTLVVGAQLGDSMVVLASDGPAPMIVSPGAAKLTGPSCVTLTAGLTGQGYVTVGSFSCNEFIRDFRSEALYAVDFENERHLEAWKTLERLQLRTDAADEQQDATRAFEGSIRVPTSIYATVWRSTQALPNTAIPHVASVLTAWRKNPPSSSEVLKSLSTFWTNADDDHRPALTSFANAILTAMRRGALRHVVAIASIQVQPRLLALCSRLRLEWRRSFPALAQLRYALSTRGPPGLPPIYAAAGKRR